MLSNSRIKEEVKQNKHKYVNEIYVDRAFNIKSTDALCKFITSSDHKLNDSDIIDILYQAATYNDIKDEKLVFMMNVYSAYDCKKLYSVVSLYQCDIVRKEKSDKTFNGNNEIDKEKSTMSFIQHSDDTRYIHILNAPYKEDC